MKNIKTFEGFFSDRDKMYQKMNKELDDRRIKNLDSEKQKTDQLRDLDNTSHDMIEISRLAAEKKYKKRGKLSDEEKKLFDDEELRQISKFSL